MWRAKLAPEPIDAEQERKGSRSRSTEYLSQRVRWKKKKKRFRLIWKSRRETNRAEERAVSHFQNSHLELSSVCFQQQKRQRYLQGGSWKYTSAPHPGGSLGKKSSAPRSTGTSAGASPGRSTGGHREGFRAVLSASAVCQEPFQQHQRLLLGDTHWQRLHIEDQEVEGEGQDDCPQQPDVDPGRHPEQGLVLRQAAGQEQCHIKTSSTRTPEIPSKGRFKYKRNHKSPSV